MQTRFVEATNGERNWGKFLVQRFDAEEWATRAAIDGAPLLRGRGWTPDHLLVVDLQTGEGGLFRPTGDASYDLEAHRLWVCPLFEPFLQWLYLRYRAIGDPVTFFTTLPRHVDFPDAAFTLFGHRRPGPDVERLAQAMAEEINETLFDDDGLARPVHPAVERTKAITADLLEFVKQLAALERRHASR